MLAKNNRLNLKLNFRWVASGKSKTTPLFKLFYRLGENQVPLVGVSIVSSQFKKATLRNEAKRIMFKVARDNLSLLHKSANLVIMPKAEILDTDFGVINQEFKNAVSSF